MQFAWDIVETHQLYKSCNCDMNCMLMSCCFQKGKIINTPEQAKEMLRLKKIGFTIKELCAKFKCSRQVVDATIKGLEDGTITYKKTKKIPPPGPRRVTTKEEDEKIIKKYEENMRIPYQKLAEYFNMKYSVGTIKNRIKAYHKQKEAEQNDNTQSTCKSTTFSKEEILEIETKMNQLQTDSATKLSTNNCCPQKSIKQLENKILKLKKHKKLEKTLLSNGLFLYKIL
eukprot:GHVT01028820.1.p1 GENE.GHVT01028820.1~~GHVT01028820.1.p1  ORF type:complete len:228 (+),score=0.12 GHVT01028820.1:300-983(+)